MTINRFLLSSIAFANLCSSKATNEIAVYVPPSDGGILTTKNFALALMCLAFLYLVIMLVQVCKQGKDFGSEYEDYYTNSYYYTEEYTNSKYAQSDDENSLVDKRYR